MRLRDSGPQASVAEIAASTAASVGWPGRLLSQRRNTERAAACLDAGHQRLGARIGRVGGQARLAAAASTCAMSKLSLRRGAELRAEPRGMEALDHEA